jgi:hypothetical protein
MQALGQEFQLRRISSTTKIQLTKISSHGPTSIFERLSQVDLKNDDVTINVSSSMNTSPTIK